MKIAITCPASLPATPFGGILIVAVNLATDFNNLGHDVTIYTSNLNFKNKKMIFDKKLPKIDNSNGFTIKRSNVILKIFTYFVNPGIYFQLKNDKPDVIHVIGVRSFQAYIAALISKMEKIPMIITDYGGLTTHPEIKNGSFIKKFLYKLQTPMIKFIMNQSKTIVASNEYELKDFSNIVKTKKIKIIRNGVDLKLLQSPKFNFKNKNQIDGRILLFVGRFDYVKGIDVLIDGFSKICFEKEFLDVKLIIMGSDFGFKNKMMKLIKEKGIEHRIKIIENPHRDEVISAYHSAEFLILPSRWELSPLTPLEGFACKKTVISCNVAGIPHVIKNEKNGILIESENSNDLTKSIRKLLKNEDLCKNLSIQGFKEIQNELNSKFMVKQFLETYTEVIKRYKK
jgi:glycosyltransferase involved in cell wall biosynthesis